LQLSLPLPFPQPLLSITTRSYHHCYHHHYHTNSTHITATIPTSIQCFTSTLATTARRPLPQKQHNSSHTLTVSCQEPVALPEQDEEVGHTWGGRARARRRRDRIGTTERGEETRCGEKKGNITCDKESRNVTSSWWAGASWEDDVGIWVGCLLPCNILEVSMSQCNSVHASS